VRRFSIEQSKHRNIIKHDHPGHSTWLLLGLDLIDCVDSGLLSAPLLLLLGWPLSLLTGLLLLWLLRLLCLLRTTVSKVSGLVTVIAYILAEATLASVKSSVCGARWNLLLSLSGPPVGLCALSLPLLLLRRLEPGTLIERQNLHLGSVISGVVLLADQLLEPIPGTTLFLAGTHTPVGIPPESGIKKLNMVVACAPCAADAEVARQLKNAASRAYHARKRKARVTAEMRALEGSARQTGEDNQRTGARAEGEDVGKTRGRSRRVANAYHVQTKGTVDAGVGEQDARDAVLGSARAKEPRDGVARTREPSVLEECGQPGGAHAC
ncbi:Unknown protein, partial [Striga hermonthica]